MKSSALLFALTAGMAAAATGSPSASNCTNVSVETDATYCIQGPICSGLGSAPAGSLCPTKGSIAVKDCSNKLSSWTSAGSCVAPVDAVCAKVKTGAWGCVYSTAKANNGTTNATSVAATPAPTTTLKSSNATSNSTATASTASNSTTTASKTCTNVSVEGDATYCIQGAICSGSGGAPADQDRCLGLYLWLGKGEQRHGKRHRQLQLIGPSNVCPSDDKSEQHDQRNCRADNQTGIYTRHYDYCTDDQVFINESINVSSSDQVSDGAAFNDSVTDDQASHQLDGTAFDNSVTDDQASHQLDGAAFDDASFDHFNSDVVPHISADGLSDFRSFQLDGAYGSPRIELDDGARKSHHRTGSSAGIGATVVGGVAVVAAVGALVVYKKRQRSAALSDNAYHGTVPTPP